MSTSNNLPWEQGSSEDDVLTELAMPVRVILFNDDWHTFDEVIDQIVRATNCTAAHAQQCTHEVHYVGKSMVFEGQMAECLRVSSVLEEIALHTQLEF